MSGFIKMSNTLRCSVCSNSKRRFKSLAALNQHIRAKHPDIPPVQRDTFYTTPEWIHVRYKVLLRDKGQCQCCGATAKTGSRLKVDHIKPRRFYPELALDMNNLQTLCTMCTRGKGNWNETNWCEKLDMWHLISLRERGLIN